MKIQHVILILLLLPLLSYAMDKPGILAYFKNQKTEEERKKEQADRATKELQDLVKDSLYDIDNKLTLKIKTLLQRGANPNVETIVHDEIKQRSTFLQPWFGMKAPLLIRALQLNNKDLIKSLIESGARLNFNFYYYDPEPNRGGWNSIESTPLIWATIHNSVELVLLMLENGADPNTKIDGKTAFDYAASDKNLSSEILILLLKHNAQIGNSGEKALFHFYFNASINNDLIKLLLERGINPNIRNEFDGRTLLMFAAAGAPGYVHENAIEYHLFQVAQLLLHYGADPLIKDDAGKTAFDYAVENKFVLVLRLLSEQPGFVLPKKHRYPPSFYIRQNRDVPLLFYAMSHDSKSQSIIPLIEFLLEKGADPRDTDEDGDNALIIAVNMNQVDIARLLINHVEKSVPAIFEKGHIQETSYLHQLPKDLQKLTTEYLKSDFYNFINHANEDGNTALIIAANKNNKEMVKLLLENGADPSIKNKYGKTALDIANEKGNQEIIKILSDSQQ